MYFPIIFPLCILWCNRETAFLSLSDLWRADINARAYAAKNRVLAKYIFLLPSANTPRGNLFCSHFTKGIFASTMEYWSMVAFFIYESVSSRPTRLNRPQPSSEKGASFLLESTTIKILFFQDKKKSWEKCLAEQYTTQVELTWKNVKWEKKKKRFSKKTFFCCPQGSHTFSVIFMGDKIPYKIFPSVPLWSSAEWRFF